MIRAFAVAAVFLLTVVFGGCGSSGQLGSIGNESVSLREFEELFARNNGGWEKASRSTMEERKAFLDLFVNYKLKLQEARARGLPADTAIQNELAAYRASVAATYIVEKELIEPALRMMYDRRKWEIRASHILLRMDSNPSPEDTLRQYQQAMNLIMRAQSMPFDSIARQFSQDPGVATNGGDLGWFTQGKMVRPFEDAVYSLSVGEVSSLPVRTQFGYHIIKVTDRQANKGSVQLSHILKRFSPGNADSTQVRDTVYAFYQRILDGTLLFEDVAMGYSDDPSSKSRFGAIGSFDRGRLPPGIADLLFSTPVRSVAPPYRAPYGYHIFKVTAALPVPMFTQAEKELRQYYQQMYYVSDYERYLHSLKIHYGLDFAIGVRYKLTHSFDSAKTPSIEGWADGVPAHMRFERLFSYAGKIFTVDQFLSHVRMSEEFRNFNLTSKAIDDMIDRIVSSTLLEHHASTADERHPAFADLMNEYEKGVIIYRLDQDEIWNKVRLNDSLLQIFFEEHRSEFQWPERVNVAEIHVSGDSLANALHQQILAGESFDALAARHTIRPQFKETNGAWGPLATVTNGLTSRAAAMDVDSVSAPFPYEKGWSIIKVLDRESSRPKTFEEARAEVTSKYQEHASKERERLWIESLKSRYGVKMNPERLSDAFKTRPAS